ncbi:hypothetical protein SBA3_1330013 [Candidatus Sulfopaludibacter sp. SbA3]|nr:hypothetical protein SBA3_1330013 [Candidatus Sulfopaludibacter sp. SbA3]
MFRPPFGIRVSVFSPFGEHRGTLAPTVPPVTNVYQILYANTRNEGYRRGLGYEIRERTVTDSNTGRSWLADRWAANPVAL